MSKSWVSTVLSEQRTSTVLSALLERINSHSVSSMVCMNPGVNKIQAHVPLLALGSMDEALKFRLEDGWQDTMFQRLLTPPNTR